MKIKREIKKTFYEGVVIGLITGAVTALFLYL